MPEGAEKDAASADAARPVRLQPLQAVGIQQHGPAQAARRAHQGQHGFRRGHARLPQQSGRQTQPGGGVRAVQRAHGQGRQAQAGGFRHGLHLDVDEIGVSLAVALGAGHQIMG